MTTIINKKETAWDVFFALGTERRFNLFRYIASNGGWLPTDLKDMFDLTVKQFYASMRILKDAGLIRRDRRKYSLTSYGKIVNECVERIVKTQDCSWMLNFLDEARLTLTPEQREEAKNALIKDEAIRNLI